MEKSEKLDLLIKENPRLQEAWDLAKDLHKEQRYGDKPYSYHLHGVAANVVDLAPVILEHACGSYEKLLEDAIIVAFLHDSVEDGKITLSALRKTNMDTELKMRYWFSKRVIYAIDNLTRRENETYPQYILNRICNNGDHITKLVKIADLRFNKEQNLKSMAEGKKHFKHMYDKYSFAEFIVMQSVYTKI